MRKAIMNQQALNSSQSPQMTFVMQYACVLLRCSVDDMLMHMLLRNVLKLPKSSSKQKARSKGVSFTYDGIYDEHASRTRIASLFKLSRFIRTYSATFDNEISIRSE